MMGLTMSSNTKVDIIITGGTIDSEWDSAYDTATVSGESVIPKYFERIKLEIELNFNVVCMKDSRKLTPEDMRQIYEAVENSASDKILITHGTYTMPDTARYIERHLKSKKAVILTGSLIPLKGYDMSDAAFNLGFSLASLLNIKEGVLLSMHGHLFKPQEVAKSYSEARFFSIEQ